MVDSSQPEGFSGPVQALKQRQAAPLCADPELPHFGKPKGTKKPKAGHVTLYNRFIREKVEELREAGPDARQAGDNRTLRDIAGQEWNQLSKAEKMQYSDKYKAEDAHGEINGEEMTEKDGGGPVLGPSNHPSPAAAGAGSLSDGAAAPGEEAATHLEGPALQEKTDVPKRVNKQKDKGKQPPAGELSAEDAPAERTNTKEVTAGRLPAGEAPDGEAPVPLYEAVVTRPTTCRKEEEEEDDDAAEKPEDATE